MRFVRRYPTPPESGWIFLIRVGLESAVCRKILQEKNLDADSSPQRSYGTLPVGGTLLGLGIIVPEEGAILRKGKG